jgi:hypothetical protein
MVETKRTNGHASVDELFRDDSEEPIARLARMYRLGSTFDDTREQAQRLFREATAETYRVLDAAIKGGAVRRGSRRKR